MFDKIKEFVEKHKLITFIIVLIIIFLLYVYFTKGQMKFYEALLHSLGCNPRKSADDMIDGGY